MSAPQRGERKELVQHALANAREALARKLADTSSQQKLLGALKETFSLPRPPGRIEVYDNSHIGGTNAVGAMVVAGPEGFRKNQYRKFNIRSSDLTPGDDYGMMREVLSGGSNGCSKKTLALWRTMCATSSPAEPKTSLGPICCSLTAGRGNSMPRRKH